METVKLNKKNENLIRLKELTDKMSTDIFNNEVLHINDIEIIDELKNKIILETNKIEKYKDKDLKISCYENLCFNIQIILDKLKQI